MAPCCDLTYRANGVDSLSFLGVIFTHRYQPAALLINDSIGKPELAVLRSERLDVTGVARQICFVQPLIPAAVISLFNAQCLLQQAVCMSCP